MLKKSKKQKNHGIERQSLGSARLSNQHKCTEDIPKDDRITLFDQIDNPKNITYLAILNELRR